MSSSRTRRISALRFGFLIVFLASAGSLFAQTSPQTTTFNGYPVVLDEVLVRLKTADNAALARVRAALPAAAFENLSPALGLLRVRIPGLNFSAWMAVLSRLADVLYVEPNYIVHATNTPNDANYPLLYGMPKISAPSAWNITTGGTGAVVGVVDTGIDYNHPDLAANMWSAPAAFTVNLGTGSITCDAGTHGYNAITRDCFPLDNNDHGSHTSGTIGAVGNNSIGVAGVNWTARIMGLKFLDASGSGSTSDAINAIEFAIQVKATFAGTATPVNVRILSNSWGGGGFSTALLDEINKANTNDILFVASAGNSGLNADVFPSYPAAYDAPNIISVAATDSVDALASFSNYGSTTVDLGAPGVNVYSTIRGGGYASFSGTSMAAPHVSGAALLTLSICPSLNTAALKNALLNNVDPVPSLAGKTVTGGRLNVYNAILSCTAGGPKGITAFSGTPQNTLVGSAFANALQAKVTDVSSNPLAGVTVTFTAPSQGASTTFNGINTATAVTNASGIATSPIPVANNAAGSYNVTASVAGFSAPFNLTNNPIPLSVSITAPPNNSTVSGTSVTVSANAAGTGLAAVQFKLDGQPLGAEDTTAPYSIFWDTTAAANGGHALTAVARDGLGNQVTSASVSVTVNNGAPPPPDFTAGLVAAYYLDEGTGNLAGDSSGNNNNGTLVNGPGWGPGKIGSALTFHRLNDYVNVPTATSLNITGNLTVAAWINPRTQAPDGDLLLTKGGCYSGSCPFDLRLNRSELVCFDQNNGAAGQETFCSTVALPLNTWTHVAVVRGPVDVRIFINGALQSGPSAFTRTPTGNSSPLNIGSGSYSFDGSLDEVRLYNRALSAADLGALYSYTGSAPPDVTPPTVSVSAPTAGATVSGTITVSATASDNIGVVGVQFKLDGQNLGAEDTSFPYSISWDTTAASDGPHTLSAVARDAAGNPGTAAGVSVTVNNADVTPPTVSVSAPTAGATVSGTITVSATASDNVGVVGVQFKLDGQNLGAEDTSLPYSISWDTTAASDGPHTLSAVARDAAGNPGTAAGVSVTVNNAPPPPDITTGLVAAYLLNEGSGDFAADSSGNNNNGTLVNGPTWTTGKSGSGLNFHRANDYVNVPTASSLNVTGALTIAAWLNPTTKPPDGDLLLTKGNCYNGSCPFDLRLNRSELVCFDQNNGAAGQETFCSTVGLPLNTWTHVAVVRTATDIRFYINGVLQTGPIAFTRTPTATSSPLNIGSSAYSFDGVMDNIRLYDRALSAADVGALYSGSN